MIRILLGVVMKKFYIALLFGFIMLGFNLKVFALDRVDEYWNSSVQVTSQNQDLSTELLMSVVARVVWDNTYGGYIETVAQSLWNDMFGRTINSSTSFPMRFEFQSSIQSTNLILIYRF